MEVAVTAFFQLSPQVLVGRRKLELPVNWSFFCRQSKFVADMLDISGFRPPQCILETFDIEKNDSAFWNLWLFWNGVEEWTSKVSEAEKKYVELMDYLQIKSPEIIVTPVSGNIIRISEGMHSNRIYF